MSFRALKKKARADLHQRMKVPAFYYVDGDSEGTPKLVHVRVHTKLNREQGDLKGTSFSYAEVEEHIPTVLFWLDELAQQGFEPARQGVVMISGTEGYRIDHLRERDLWTQHAEVATLTEHERESYAYPEEA